jgi:hypothetical protein
MSHNVLPGESAFFRNHFRSYSLNQKSVISTEGGAFAAIVEKSASLPQSRNRHASFFRDW